MDDPRPEKSNVTVPPQELKNDVLFPTDPRGGAPRLAMQAAATAALWHW